MITHDILHPLSVLITESEAPVTHADMATRLSGFIQRVQLIHGKTEAFFDEVNDRVPCHELCTLMNSFAFAGL